VRQVAYLQGSTVCNLQINKHFLFLGPRARRLRLV